MSTAVQSRISTLLCSEFKVANIQPDTSILRDLGLDSVSLLTFLMLLENDIRVDIFGRGLDLSRTHTVEALAHFIEEKCR